MVRAVPAHLVPQVGRRRRGDPRGRAKLSEGCPRAGVVQGARREEGVAEVSRDGSPPYRAPRGERTALTRPQHDPEESTHGTDADERVQFVVPHPWVPPEVGEVANDALDPGMLAGEVEEEVGEMRREVVHRSAGERRSWTREVEIAERSRGEAICSTTSTSRTAPRVPPAMSRSSRSRDR